MAIPGDLHAILHRGFGCDLAQEYKAAYAVTTGIRNRMLHTGPSAQSGHASVNKTANRPTESIDQFAQALTLGTRLIGIDVGSKTLGLALSDVTRMIASGFDTIQRSKFTVDATRLIKLAAQHGVGGFVIGWPAHLDGSMSRRAQATRAFATNLAKLTPLPILLWDERLSTVAAGRALLESDASRRRRAKVIDKVAATLILQGALDRMRNR
jgi:putative holliday junction resolvase